MTMRNKPINGAAEVRAFSMPDLRAISDGNVVEGHAAVFGERANIGGWFTEVFERGAFDSTDFTDVLFSVINHDMRSLPLARSRNNNANSTLQLKIDDQGLYTRALLDVERNADALALYSAVERADVSGMSLIFFVRADRWEGLDSELPTRYVTDVSRVIEVSPASFPAYDGTDINARDQRALDSAARVLESARSRLESQNNERASINEFKSALLGKEVSHSEG